MTKYENKEYIRLIYDEVLKQNSILKPYYFDIYKVIWKEKYEDFSAVNEKKKTKRVILINACIQDFLSLMCQEPEFNNAQDLDAFYKSSLVHRSDFLKDAHSVIMHLGMQKIIKEQPDIQKQYAGTLVNQTYKHNKFHGEAPFSLSLGDKFWTEQQVYAIASIYALELALISFEDNDINSLSRIQSDLYRFLSGPEYNDVLGIKGANAKHLRNREYKNRAEEIYNDKNLYQLSNNTASYDLRKLLVGENMDVAQKTLETRWIPDFRKQAKILKSLESDLL